VGETVDMPSIIHHGNALHFSLCISKRRKTITLRVNRNGSVAVTAPSYVKTTIVRRFVKSKVEWVLDKQKYFLETARKYPPKEFKNGETFPLLGRKYRLKIVKVPELHNPSFKTEGGRLMIFVDRYPDKEQKEITRETVQEWYTIHTEKKVNILIKKYAPYLDVLPMKIKVVDQTSRWASCSKSRIIRFNWRLSTMPISVLEYIVVHELCHLKIHNHSTQFWRAVKSVLPDYENRRTWLRENGSIIALMF
jgi:predicted metal-dependent hydrolase